MNDKINVSEILALCESGLELYSPAYGKLIYVGIESPKYILCKSGSGVERKFSSYGKLSLHGEIMLFPSKDQRDWNLFNVPEKINPIYNLCQIITRDGIKYEVIDITETDFTIRNLETTEIFTVNLSRQGEFSLNASPIFKAGDIIINRSSKDIYEILEVTDWIYRLGCLRGFCDTVISINSQDKYTLVKFKSGNQIRCTRGGKDNSIYTVTEIDADGNYSIHSNCESFKLLLDLQDNYELVEEDNSLIPIFKIGDKIREILKPEHVEIISGTFKSGYWLEIEKDEEKPKFLVYIDQDKYELVPEKFDINTLKPFDRVLVRIDDTCAWCAGIFSHISFNGTPMVTGYKTYKKCIPFEGNEHLLGTLDDCSDFYKI